MAKRKLMRKKTDRKIFKITANQTRKENLPQFKKRGGDRM